MKKIAVLFLSLLLSLALFGCGGGEKKSTAQPPAKEPAKTEASAPNAESDKYGKYLSAAEVEKVTGLTGLKTVEKDLTISFVGNNDEIVYEVRFYGSDFYEKEVTGNRKYYTDVPGVGDKAAICIPNSPYRLTFAKGDKVLMTQTLAKDEKQKVKEAQLIELAKIIAGKL